MIKDVMVSLDGTPADEIRLAAVADIAEYFDAQVRGLFLNVLPPLSPAEWEGLGASQVTRIMEEARNNSEKVATKVKQRLARLQLPVELRRVDVPMGSQGDVAAREARSADVFVGLRPNGASSTSEQLVESVLFETGRHLFLTPEGGHPPACFDRILVAWNGSREATRAIAEAMPYMIKAAAVDVIVVGDAGLISQISGADIVDHLVHHGIGAALHEVKPRADGVAATLIAEAHDRNADLIVMGGYGHSRFREWLLGGVTYQLMHRAAIPLIIAH